jgi:peptide/nickel transport system substrate-binding protein
MRSLLSMSAIALFFALPGHPALANKANDTLKVAFTKELESADFYFTSAREGVLLSRSVWDGLLYRDAKTGEYKGNLATSWKRLDNTTIEFKLREGVKFHDGEEFDADDVVYTVNTLADPANPVAVPDNVRWMKEAKKIDKYTVQLVTNGPFPAAYEFLASITPIYPNDYYAKVGRAGMAVKPIGTGPYKVESLEPGKHFVLKKFDGYHEGARPKASIGTLDIRTIPDINTQMAELFSGGLDLIWGVPTDQADKLSKMGQFTVKNESTMRIGYITMDAAGRGGDNPFMKKAVREAVAHAIDRKAIVDNLLKGSSRVVNTACYPSQFGCEQDVKTYAYDPGKAKKLLAEAGYSGGFTVDLYAYRDRPIAEAMMSYLSNVGIKTKLNYLQYSAVTEMHKKGQGGFAFMTWGSNSVDDVSASASQFFKFKDWDFARDPEVRDWLTAGDNAIDSAARKANYAKALKKIAEEAYWLPLFSYSSNYVFTKETNFVPTPDEVVRFSDISWK